MIAEKSIAPRDSDRGQAGLAEDEAKRRLALEGISIPRSCALERAVVLSKSASRDIEETLRGARISSPVMVKIRSAQVIHKTDIGGVAGPFTTVESIREAARSMCAANPECDGVLVEQFIPPEGSVDFLLGILKNDAFGYVVGLGAGGTQTELFDDVTWGIVPLSRGDVVRMLGETKAGKLLSGYRGAAKISSGPLVDAALAIAGKQGLLSRRGGASIQELEINPLRVTSDAAWALDCKWTVGGKPRNGLSNGEVERPRFEQRDWRRLLQPKSVVVVGLSSQRRTPGNIFAERLRSFGYEGALWAIHPTAREIDGIPCFSSFADLPGETDYSYIAVPPESLQGVVSSFDGRVKFAQFLTSGFGETNKQGLIREQQLVRTARSRGNRFLGPNSLGIYSPAGRLTFFYDRLPKEAGRTVLLSQSGGLLGDLLRRGTDAGIRFRAGISLGNSADLDWVDLYEACLRDPDVDNVAMYLESGRRGHQFCELLRRSDKKLRTIVLSGGVSAAGGTAAVSHTGAMTLGTEAWQALESQFGLVVVQTLDELITGMQFLHYFPGGRGNRTLILGPGGGMSVLVADWATREFGLSLPSIPSRTKAKILKLGLPPGTTIANPVDLPAGTLQVNRGQVMAEILAIMLGDIHIDNLVIHLNLPAIAAFTARGVDTVRDLLEGTKSVVNAHSSNLRIAVALRNDEGGELEDLKDGATRDLGQKVPVCSEVRDALLGFDILRRI